MPKIARVVLDLALDREFDYLVPDELDGRLEPGMRVIVPLGRRTASGYIVGFADSSEFPDLKPIHKPIGTKPLIEPNLMNLARWIADYYAAPVELAIRSVLPSAVRQTGARFKEISVVALSEKGRDALAVAELRRRAPAQGRILDALATEPVPLPELLVRANASSSTVRALAARGFITIGKRVLRRRADARHIVVPTQPPQLMEQQAAALEVIRRSVERREPPVVLLHGVTGSGKTEVYLQAIDLVLKRGGGCIVLVPEISLTPQTVDRFRARFGDTVAVLHSELSAGERHDEWHRLHDGEARIAIGPRSAVFAPVRNLGLIVVDEEHEHSYKQEEAPRYHARDVAVMRGKMEGCAVVLGSATPSIESIYNAQIGKYQLVRMPARVDHRDMPAMRIVDMRQEIEKEGRLNVLSRDLRDAIRARLDRGEQTILFLNRRGFATSLVCIRCGTSSHCPHCSVNMTYHKTTERLICHICGLQQPVPDRCPNPSCADPGYKFFGMGTQRVEEALRKVFPHARIARMDSDTMTRKDAYRTTLGSFRAGQIDILLGTQMIAKGLDFPGVTLVGVVNADLSLHLPDFRAGERTFQLLTQVAGRAGRGERAGEVIVQTFTPFHPAIQAARRLDFDGFIAEELEFRRELEYPPFTRLVLMTLCGPHEEAVKLVGEQFLKRFLEYVDTPIKTGGPAPAPLARAKGEFRYHIVFRAPSARAVTKPLRKALADFKWPKGVSWSVDVDAISVL
ncbi:MAG: primosomal protein N' [Kiritimatiellae bacterium]|nr:primosomal protein N' [Kiritimatiellia bacterium]MDW8459426.1 primosomal protein N' [Verrucomicrobiota bacterium]